MDGAASSKRDRKPEGDCVSEWLTARPTITSTVGAPDELCNDIATSIDQFRGRLLRVPLELTILSLDHTSASLEFPLGLVTISPRALQASELRLVVSQPWGDPFRLVRVAVYLPIEYVSLDPTLLCDAISSIISNMSSEAVLQVPCIPFSRANGREHITRRLQIAMREGVFDPGFGRGVLVEIPVPAGITLHPGAAITLSISVAGSTVTLRIPATSHIHCASCNHNREGAGAVYSAAKAGRTAALEAALAAGGSTEEVDEYNKSAVLCAAQKGHLEAVLVLIQAGADVTAPDQFGSTPVHIAAKEGHLPVLQALLRDPRVNPGKRTNAGTPLSLATKGGHLSIVQALLRDPRVNPAEGTETGHTSIHMAAGFGHLAILQALLRDPRVDPGAQRTDDGWTPLHCAARNDHLSVVRALLQDPRVDPGLKNWKGDTPLDWSRKHDRPAVAQALEAHARRAEASTGMS